MRNRYSQATQATKDHSASQQNIQDDLDRWRDESPAAGRVTDLNEDSFKRAVGKGLRAVAEYRSELEDRVRRFPGSSVLVALGLGLVAGMALVRCVETYGFRRGR
jgi:hypothetical protein